MHTVNVSVAVVVQIFLGFKNFQTSLQVIRIDFDKHFNKKIDDTKTT